MINLFYETSYWGGSSTMNGPKKVVTNLTDSLNKMNVPFAVNEEKYKYNFLIHYDYNGYLKHSKLTLENCFLGPQLWFFDNHIKHIQENPNFYNKIIVPSDWVKYLAIEKFNFPLNKIAIWPVGIELKEYSRNVKYDFLIYFKRRDLKELQSVEEFMNKNKLTYNIIQYGSYNQKDLEELCDQSKFCFLLNGTESQGIAVQEIMARNLPMLVWDVNCWNDMGSNWVVPASSVPFWSNECGVRFVEETELENAYKELCSKEYFPRKFVEEELSYDKSVNKLLEIFNAN